MERARQTATLLLLHHITRKASVRLRLAVRKILLQASDQTTTQIHQSESQNVNAEG